MANPSDALVQLQLNNEVVRDAAVHQARQLGAYRIALKELLEGVDLALESLPAHTEQGRVLRGSMAGRDAAARLVLNRP